MPGNLDLGSQGGKSLADKSAHLLPERMKIVKCLRFGCLKIKNKQNEGIVCPTFMYMLVYIHKLPLDKDAARGTGQPPL